MTVTATDPGGLSATQSFQATVPNRAPAAQGSMPEQTVEVGESAAMDVTDYFSDPDGDALTYMAVSSDAAVVVVSISAGDLTVESIAKGRATVTVTATDTEGLAATQEFAVTAPNQPPVTHGSIAARTIEVDETGDLDLSSYFSDPDGDALVFTATVSDAAIIGASVDGAALTVGAIAKGEATVTVTATDTEGLTARQEFVVTVPNRPPFAAGSIDERTVEVDETAELDLSPYFSDPDGDALTFAATVSDAAIIGTSVDGSALTVGASAKGAATVTVTATDTEGLTAIQAFVVTVPNRPPLGVGSIDERTLEVGRSATLEVSGYFEDPDGDVLAYAVISSDAARIGASVAGAAVTVEALAKGNAVVTVTATDTEGLTATQEFVVTIPNQPPMAAGSIDARTLEVDETADLNLSAYFSDPDGDALVFSATVSDAAVIGASVDGAALTVGAIAKGEATVTVTATDTEGLASTQEFAVTVPNRPPFAAGAFEARTVEVGGTADLNLPNHFSDPDGDALTFAATVSDAAIIGASVDGGALTVSAVAKGEATVTVTVTDTEGLTATQAFAVTVPNRPPHAVGSIDQRTMEIGGSATLELPGYFEDPDGDALDYAVTSSDVTLIGASVEGAVLTVEAMAKGGAIVTVTATDTEGLAATQEFAVSVANRPPHAVGSIAAQNVAVGETAAMELPGYFEDPDGDALVYAATVPEGSVIELAISGTAVTITALRKGEAAVTVTVADTEGMMATQEFIVIVPNRAPQAFGNIPEARLIEGSVKRIDPSSLFSDPDEDALIFEVASSSPQVARTWVSGERVLVRALKEGTATVTITAKDAEGLEATQQFSMRVNESGGGSDPNHPPVATGTILEQKLEEGDKRMLNASSYFADPDDDALAFTAESSDHEVVKAGTSGSEVELEVVSQGTATVTVTAEDPAGLETDQVFAVTVQGAGSENRAPAAIGTVADQSLEVDGSATLDASAYFTDPDDDALVYSAGSSDNAVATATVSGSGVTLQATGSGTATVTLTAQDPEGLEAELTFDVTVVAPVPNRPPVAGTIASRFLENGKSETLDVTYFFSDPDEDVLVFSVENSDAGVVVATLSGTDLEMQGVAEGTSTITVTAEDPEGLSASGDFDVTVTPEGAQPPYQKKELGNVSYLVGAELGISSWWYFSDPDTPFRRLKTEVASSDPEVLKAETTSYMGGITLTAMKEGEATIYITVTDPDGLWSGLSAVHTVGNNPPTIKIPVPDAVRAPGETYSFFVQEFFIFHHVGLFQDPDVGDRMEFAVSSSDSTVATASIENTGLGLYVLVTAVSVGEATITTTATDLGGLSTDWTFVLTVEN